MKITKPDFWNKDNIYFDLKMRNFIGNRNITYDYDKIVIYVPMALRPW